LSLFGAMSTAISGLTAQAAAFANISDNTANSQTTGYKGVNTNFIDYLTESTASINQSGSVVSRPAYQNDLQGAITQSNDPLALAIDGQGFFAVSTVSNQSSSGQPTFNKSVDYTRAGDFSLDNNGYIKNSANEYLNGYEVDPSTGTLDTTKLVPIQIAQTQYKPVATSNVTLSANVPATPDAASTLSSQVQIYDATGTSHELTTSWVQNSNDNWTMTVSSPDNTTGTIIGTVHATFNTNGTLASLSGATGSVAVTGTATTAAISLSPNFTGTAQPITMNLGNYNTATGVTQFAGTDYEVHGLTQDGAAPGSFTGISTTTTGDIIANYDNGQVIRVAHVPIETFEDPDALQRQNAQAFSVTEASGAAATQNAGQNGAGSLVTGSVESSNVDIATELTKLIVAQQAYGANAKVITTANQLMQTTIDIKQ
jgi:flagellar hook protein FlgE